MSAIQSNMVSSGAGSSASATNEAERRLVELAKRNRDAFALLYRQHYPAIAAYVYRRTGDRHATEDLVADVFVIVLRTLARFRYRGVPFRYWLLRIATNTVNRWARRQRRRQPQALPDDGWPDPRTDAASGVGGIDRERAQSALLSLSAKYQAVLALHYFEGLSVTDVAAVIGCRPGTVKSRLSRARDALRAKLEDRR